MARRISTPDFLARLRTVAESESGVAARHAGWVLQAIEHEGPLPASRAP
jgi:hypothetical protein